ncbi:MAG: hypothetical protein ACTHMR_11990 [Thermomicrobiales bacterium]
MDADVAILITNAAPAIPCITRKGKEVIFVMLVGIAINSWQADHDFDVLVRQLQ